MSILGDVWGGVQDVLSSPAAQQFGMGAALGLFGGGGGGPAASALGGGAAAVATGAAGAVPFTLVSDPANGNGTYTGEGPGLDWGDVSDYLTGAPGTPNLCAVQTNLYSAPKRNGCHPVPRIMRQRGNRVDVWEYAGRPLVMSRDLAVSKRTRRVGRKLLSATGGLPKR